MLPLCVLQPHGRDEPLITGKMWKHIITQGLYQMFWLFFFLYGTPRLFERYRITDHCTFAVQGGNEAAPDPGFCTTLIAGASGAPPASVAGFYCGVMTGCGLGATCGGSARQTAACPFAALMPPGTPVPDNAAAAFNAAGLTGGPSAPGCSRFPAGACPDASGYSAALRVLDKAWEVDADYDFRKADSLLFNSFIFLQLLNEVNARRIKDELHVFEGLHRSPIFIAVLAITAGLQVCVCVVCTT